jgi:hypothetical protein
MSATRVMGTTSLMGQAVGTAAAIAAREGLTPRGVYEKRLAELQQALMDDDCFLPWRARTVPELTRGARLAAGHGDPEPLRNGVDRPVGEDDNGWTGPLGAPVDILFDRALPVREVRLVFDSDLNRVDPYHPERKALNMRHCYARDADPWRMPGTLVRGFRIEALGADGAWSTAFREENNYARLVRVPLAMEAQAVRFVPESTWGADAAHLFAFDVR